MVYMSFDGRGKEIAAQCRHRHPCRNLFKFSSSQVPSIRLTKLAIGASIFGRKNYFVETEHYERQILLNSVLRVTENILY
jgi:hypothetical protein